MNKILIAVIIGVVAGVIDVIPMIIQKLNKTSCLSAFFHYMVLGTIIPFVDWNLLPSLKGMIIAFLLSVPVMIIVYSNDKKAVIPMTIFSLILGSGIGWAGAFFID